jgi:hypothetical protein
MIKNAVMTILKVQCGLERMCQEAFRTNLMYYVD